MKQRVDLHGLEDCPFAWRARLAAEEKQVPFEWIVRDVDRPDARAETHNPDGLSPLLIHDWLTLTESMVICQYLDEAFPGRALQNEDPAKRALERLAMLELDFELPEDGQKERATRAFESLEVRLRESPWLGGEAPSLLDIKVLPLMADVILRRKHAIPAHAERCREYWKRWQQRESYQSTCPSWAS